MNGEMELESVEPTEQTVLPGASDLLNAPTGHGTFGQSMVAQSFATDGPNVRNSSPAGGIPGLPGTIAPGGAGGPVEEDKQPHQDHHDSL